MNYGGDENTTVFGFWQTQFSSNWVHYEATCLCLVVSVRRNGARFLHRCLYNCSVIFVFPQRVMQKSKQSNTKEITYQVCIIYVIQLWGDQRYSNLFNALPQQTRPEFIWVAASTIPHLPQAMTLKSLKAKSQKPLWYFFNLMGGPYTICKKGRCSNQRKPVQLIFCR